KSPTILLLGLGLQNLCALLVNPFDSSLAAQNKAPLATLAAGSPTQIAKPIPQPNLGAVQNSVREQIESAWAELQAATQQSGIDQRQLADAYGQMGKVYHAYDFSEAAEACYQNAMGLAPADFSWPYALGRLYQDQGEIKKSIEYLGLADKL